MAIEDEIKTVLSADSTFTSAMTGGVFTRDDLGRMGMEQGNNPTLYDSDLRLKYVCLINPRDEIGTNAIRDDVEKVHSYQQVVELYFYADGDASRATLVSARDRAYALLHGLRTATSNARLEWLSNRRGYDYALDNAMYERSDYQVNNTKKGT